VLVVVEDVTDLIDRIRDYRAMRNQACAEAARARSAEEALRRAQAGLEGRVRHRTAELVSTNRALQVEIAERRRAEGRLREAHAQNELLLASIPSILIGLAEDLRVLRWNAAATKAFGIPAERVVNRPFGECGIQWDWQRVLVKVQQCRRDAETVRFEDIRFTRPDGSEGILGLTANPVVGRYGRVSGVLLLGADVTERRRLEGQLAQAQKLEAMGQLAAGIAHEINTPTQYVGDNTRFLGDAFADLAVVLERCGALLEAGQGPPAPERVEELRAAFEEADVEYLMAEVPRAIAQSLEGIECVTKIVRAMKAFSHPDRETKVAADLNGIVQNAVTVCRNEWKYVSEVKLDLDPALPEVPCLPGALNQMLLNLIINAAHAVGDVVGRSGAKGRITISTRRAGAFAELRVADTGCGITEEVRPKVFQLFFTTKEAGRGTGQGLAIARAIVVEKHGGSIDFETEVGKGTTFIIRLPIEPAEGQPDPRPEEAVHAA